MMKLAIITITIMMKKKDYGMTLSILKIFFMA